MSDVADQVRDQRRRWAAPGSSHDGVVRVLGWTLPVLVGVLTAFLAMAPFTNAGDISFVLAKDKVDMAHERMRVTAATYRGEDSKGRPFRLTAGSAVQATSRIPVLKLDNLAAEIQQSEGPARLIADTARYDIKDETVKVDGPVRFSAADGYRLDTRDVTVDLRSRQLTGTGAVSGSMRLGNFSAGGMRADLESRVVVLDGRARLRIVQGGLR